MLELNEQVKFILGCPSSFWFPYAILLRQLGKTIPANDIEERAAVIHWMLCLYEEHGDDWQAKMAEIVLEAEASPDWLTI